MRMLLRTATAATLVALGPLAAVSSPASAGDVWYCHGQTATIVDITGADVTGTDGDDVIVANGTVHAGEGNDTVCAPDMYGEGGDDLLQLVGAGSADGGDGDDLLLGSNHDDALDGGAGADEIRARGGSDEAFGRGGQDLVYGAAGVDILRAGGGDDVLFGGDGDDLVDGGKGEDRGQGGAGHDKFVNMEHGRS